MNWSEIKKELNARNEEYFKKLIPLSGMCDTMEGEMLRAINKIIYRHWNDGDYFYKGYGCTTAGPAHSYLVNKSCLSYELDLLFKTVLDKDSDYESICYEALEIILDYIDSKQGQYEKNTTDMLNSTPTFQDEEDEEGDGYYCEGCGEEEQWCSCYDDEDDD